MKRDTTQVLSMLPRNPTLPQLMAAHRVLLAMRSDRRSPVMQRLFEEDVMRLVMMTRGRK